MNRHWGKFRIFKFGMKLEVKFTSDTNPIVKLVEQICHRVTTGGALWPHDLGVARHYHTVRTWRQTHSMSTTAQVIGDLTVLLLYLFLLCYQECRLSAPLLIATGPLVFSPHCHWAPWALRIITITGAATSTHFHCEWRRRWRRWALLSILIFFIVPY